MGQRLREDKITALTESGGTITMPAGAILTIGGQQYVTTSDLNVAADLGSANSRYQIYAILNVGVVELEVSSNENSVGPAGASAWKLVGSYYTGTQSQFLQFADVMHAAYSNIKETLNITGSGAFTGGTLSVSRSGNQISVQAETPLTFAAQATPTSNVGFIPDWAIPDATRWNLYINNGANYVARSQVTSSGALSIDFSEWDGSDDATNSTDDSYTSISYSVQDSQISITPIKDL